MKIFAEPAGNWNGSLFDLWYLYVVPLLLALVILGFILSVLKLAFDLPKDLWDRNARPEQNSEAESEET